MSFSQLMQHATSIRDKAVRMDQIRLANKIDNDYPQMDDSQRRQLYLLQEPEIRLAYEDIPQLFTSFSQIPDPAGYNPLIGDLTSAMSSLCTGQGTGTELSKPVVTANPQLDKLTTVGGYLDDWTGSAARNFKENFLDTFKTVSTNQFTLISTMKGTLEAHQNMWRSARVDVDKIAHTTLAALDNIGSCDKNQWTFAFSVVSAAAMIAGTVVTAVTAGPAAAAFPAVGAAAAVGTSVTAYMNASGNTPSQVVASMRLALSKLTKHINDVETKTIALNVRNIVTFANNNRDRLVAPRPQLASMDDRDLVNGGGLGMTH